MEEMFLHLTYESNCDGNVLIIFITLISFLFFPTFFLVHVKDHELYKFVQLCKYYVSIICIKRMKEQM